MGLISPGGSGGTTITSYRKTTQKSVTGTLVETDLFNGEITVAANAIGTTGHLFGRAYGDAINNVATENLPRIKLKLGATTIFDTGAPANGWAQNAGTFGWWMDFDIQNTATNAQVCKINGVVCPLAAAAIGPAFTTGEGIIQSAGANNPVYIAGYNTAAEDTTASKALVLSVILPVSNVACIYTLDNAIVWIL